ncbi:hypothetical protein GGS23DRAFT_137584 [Durotheca rogersii]|uniref:uncharacterized protein n=1 Tax=Durotheca rogersii TaxID=419775 RepID=UPI00221EBA47|nr:uncharacterized protein GGS23DRAFT_137584 [Durotheca rogersii]KAI5861521.1 hypothetical protein GGS23DRAFT_137584 [Durotheca rogersii]
MQVPGYGTVPLPLNYHRIVVGVLVSAPSDGHAVPAQTGLVGAISVSGRGANGTIDGGPRGEAREKPEGGTYRRSRGRRETNNIYSQTEYPPPPSLSLSLFRHFHQSCLIRRHLTQSRQGKVTAETASHALSSGDDDSHVYEDPQIGVCHGGSLHQQISGRRRGSTLLPALLASRIPGYWLVGSAGIRACLLAFLDLLAKTHRSLRHRSLACRNAHEYALSLSHAAARSNL